MMDAASYWMSQYRGLAEPQQTYRARFWPSTEISDLNGLTSAVRQLAESG